MSATSSSSFPLATEDPYTGGGSSVPDTGIDDESGASGSSTGSAGISHGGLIAIIVVVVVVAIFGSESSCLVFLGPVLGFLLTPNSRDVGLVLSRQEA